MNETPRQRYPRRGSWSKLKPLWRYADPSLPRLFRFMLRVRIPAVAGTAV